jgi:hypothetical protein
LEGVVDVCRRFAACPNWYARGPGAHAPGYEYVAASRLHLMRRVVTRKRVPPLRGLARSPHMGVGDARTRIAASPHEDCGDPGTCVATSRLHPVRIAVTRKRVSSLRFLERSPHLGGGNAHTRVVASRLRPMRIVVTRVRVSLLRGSGRLPHRDGCAPVCGSRDPWPAPKARQIFSLGRQPQDSGGRPIKEPRRQIHSLGREPQETVRPTPTSPEGATDLWPVL